MHDVQIKRIRRATRAAAQPKHSESTDTPLGEQRGNAAADNKTKPREKEGGNNPRNEPVTLFRQLIVFREPLKL